MSDRDDADLQAKDAHDAAAEAFVSRVEQQFGDAIETVTVFGSTVRGEAEGRSSDVDVLVVLANETDRSDVEDVIREVAYDVMLEYGPVIELHILTRGRFDALHERRNPFVRQAVSEGRSYG